MKHEEEDDDGVSGDVILAIVHRLHCRGNLHVASRMLLSFLDGRSHYITCLCIEGGLVSASGQEKTREVMRG